MLRSFYTLMRVKKIIIGKNDPISKEMPDSYVLRMRVTTEEDGREETHDLSFHTTKELVLEHIDES